MPELTQKRIDALSVLAEAGQDVAASGFARRLWGRKINSGGWQRAGSFLRKLADDGLVIIIRADDYRTGTDLYRISEAGRKALADAKAKAG